MATGKVTVLDLRLLGLGLGTFNLSTDVFKVALCTSSQALTAAFTGASGQALYSDLTAEVVGPGYTAGGAALAATSWTRSGAVATFDADPTEWLGLDATVKYGVIYRPTGGQILGYFDVDAALPAGRVVPGVDFIINWAAALFTLTRV